MFKVIRVAVTKRDESPTKNKTSAYFSYFIPISVLLRMAKKDKMQLNINENIANAVNSSINVAAFISRIFLDVKTIKHKPNKLAEVFKMCCELELFFFIFTFHLSKKPIKIYRFFWN